MSLRSPQRQSLKAHRSRRFLKIIITQLWMMMMTSDDAMDVHFDLRLLDKAAETMFIVIIISVVCRPEKRGTCGAGEVVRATPSKTHQ